MSSRTRGLLALLLWAGCGAEPSPVDHLPPPADRPHPASPTAQIASAEGFPLGRFPAAAVPRADRGADLVAPCEGRVREVQVTPGDLVAAGQAVAELRCLDAGVLYTRRDTLGARLRRLDTRLRELRTLREEGLTDKGAVVEVELEALAVRQELGEVTALLERSSLSTRGGAPTAEAFVPLHAPRDGIVDVVAIRNGSHLERIGAPILSIVAASTDRIEVPLLAGPAPATAFAFIALDGQRDPVTLLSLRPMAGEDTRGAEPHLRATFVSPRDLPVGTRGHVLMTTTREDAGVVPADALVRRPEGGDAPDTLCLHAPEAPERCRPVTVLGATGDRALVADAPGAPPFVRAGVEVRRALPAAIDGSRGVAE